MATEHETHGPGYYGFRRAADYRFASPVDPVLREAGEIMAGDREQSYGDAVEMCSRIGRMWAPLLGLSVPLTAREVAWCLVAMKAARDTAVGGEPKTDNAVDAAAYAAIAERARRAESDEV